MPIQNLPGDIKLLNRLDDISWDELFAKFEENKLAFLYQEQVSGDDTSRFFKFVKR